MEPRRHTQLQYDGECGQISTGIRRRTIPHEPVNGSECRPAPARALYGTTSLPPNIPSKSLFDLISRNIWQIRPHIIYIPERAQWPRACVFGPGIRRPLSTIISHRSSVTTLTSLCSETETPIRQTFNAAQDIIVMDKRYSYDFPSQLLTFNIQTM